MEESRKKRGHRYFLQRFDLALDSCAEFHLVKKRGPEQNDSPGRSNQISKGQMEKCSACLQVMRAGQKLREHAGRGREWSQRRKYI